MQPNAPASLRARKARQTDEGQWRVAAEEGLRLAARRWQIPLDNISEMKLVDADGPCYLFKVLYTDANGQRFTGAIHIPKNISGTSSLSMTMFMPGQGGQDLGMW